MSGKGAGKKRNRAAQSEQHGYQEPQIEHAAKPGTVENMPGNIVENEDRERVVEKLRRLEQRRKDQER